MSMTKLSTELDCKIARFLIGDNRTLSALSQVSKYYRKVIEPFLYEALDFSEDDNGSLQCLLLTLLDRTDLASKITTFSMFSTLPRCRSQASLYSFNERKWSYVERIRSKIDEVVGRTGREYGKGYRLRWFVKVLSEEPDKPDATLALILCLAHNLVGLRVCDQQELYITFTMLGVEWPVSEAAPFKKLKELYVHKFALGKSFHDLPPVEHMIVENTRRAWGEWTSINQIAVPLHWEPFYFSLVEPTDPSIRSIVFIGLELITPKLIARMISFPWLANVKELVIKSCGVYYERTGQFDDHFDLPVLVRALERHVPNLEHFEFTRALPGTGSLQFNNFTNLKELRTLAVSLNTVPRQGEIDWELFFGCHNVFPEGLEYLTLENLKVDQLSELIQQFRVDFGAADNPAETYSNLLKLLPPEFHLKGLAIAIDMDCYTEDYHQGVLELAPEDVAFCRDMADELMKNGVKFEVFRTPGPTNLFYKLLVKPGWTAQRPHSSLTPMRSGDRYTSVVNKDRVWDL